MNLPTAEDIIEKMKKDDEKEAKKASYIKFRELNFSSKKTMREKFSEYLYTRGYKKLSMLVNTDVFLYMLVCDAFKNMESGHSVHGGIFDKSRADLYVSVEEVDAISLPPQSDKCRLSNDKKENV